MKKYVNIFLLYVLILSFSACKKEEVDHTESLLIGKWEYKQEPVPINVSGISVVLEVYDNHLFEIYSPGISTWFAIDSAPGIGGSWSYEKPMGRLKLFETPNERFPVDGFLYYWKILALTDTTLSVSVTDKDGIFVHDRTFKKVQ